ncbi:MAG: ferrous iron transporter B [Planctomycetota bacterium]|jgi:ferrous iron transport protein B
MTSVMEKPLDETTPAASRGSTKTTPCFALLGNPNTGKTTLFARLCGIRAKTTNFPGSTVEALRGQCLRQGGRVEIIDLPGVYALNLDLPESRLCRECLDGHLHGRGRPDGLLVVADATNLPRNLQFVAQALRTGVPTVVALNMIDLAQRRGLTIDAPRLSRHLGCPVVPVSARSGAGVDALVEALHNPGSQPASLPDPEDARAVSAWTGEVLRDSVGGEGAVGAPADSLTDRLDAAFTHPWLGLLTFAAIMTGLFVTIFSLATIPMQLIDVLFGHLGTWLGRVIPPGAINDLAVNGVVAGVAGTVVFLPQICLLFFLISLLEDTGYLARAAFVMDRLLRRFGLPGQAFVPLLSAHACAIPAIMSARLIPDRRDRIATVLVAPLMSCSARLPVYVLLIGFLFGDQPLWAGLAFTGCYVLGATVALLTALVARRTLLKGRARPMVLELPTYKLPSLRAALLITFDRAAVFLRKAGTVIVAISIVLWWLSAYPATRPPAEAAALRAQARIVESRDAAAAERLLVRADVIQEKHALAHSFVGRIGRFAEPVFRPLGYDWQLTIGVLTSFAAREVFVSTMAVIFASNDDADEPAVIDRIRSAQRSDGEPLFTKATSASLLVFYVLAMQCLPTLPVTRRETGSWKWALLQIGYMSCLAYGAALLINILLTGGAP